MIMCLSDASVPRINPMASWNVRARESRRTALILFLCLGVGSVDGFIQHSQCHFKLGPERTSSNSKRSPHHVSPVSSIENVHNVVSKRLGAAQLAIPSAVLMVLLGAASPSWAQISLPGLWQPSNEKTDGYELAPVQKDGKPSPVLLVPVIQATEDLNRVAELIQSGSTENWEAAYKVLEAKPFNPPVELKRIFNAYTDNIYFSGDTRRNMYLDGSAMLGMGKSTFGFGTLSVGNGGASPETKDTMTYLYRNEALSNVDALAAELRYLLAQRGKGVEESTEDLAKYIKAAQAGFANYLSAIPPEELKAAQEYVKMKAGK